MPVNPTSVEMLTESTLASMTPASALPVPADPDATILHLLPAPTSDISAADTIPLAENRPLVNGKRLAPTDVIKLAPKTMSRNEIGALLGWVNAPDANLICRGYYIEPNLNYYTPYQGSVNNAPITITADQSLLSQTSTSRLSGHVTIMQPERSIDSELAYINRNPQTLKAESIDAYGQVVLREPGNLAIANQGHFDLLDKSSSLSDVIYRMTFGQFTESVDNPVGSPITNTNVNSWGIAKTAIRQSDGIIKIHKGTYSACPPPSNIWHIDANNLTLNHTSGRGSATNAFLFLGDMPVFYTPYFSFPLDNRRKTGFLYPTFGHSTTSGYELGIPFYWNIAPNYDATITPVIMTAQGIQLNGVFRYLTPDSTGNIHGSFLPNDKQFADFQQDALNDTDTYPPGTYGLDTLENDSDNRYLVSLKDTRSYSSNWSSYLYVNHVSDDYYFEDFNNDPAQLTQNQIINQGDLYYNSEHWNFTGQLEGYQTLHPINQSYVANQYRELPELTLNGQYPDIIGNLNAGITNQFDDFSIVQDPVTGEQPEGTRLNVTPDINYPKNWIWGYIKPDIQLSTTQYNLTHQIPGEETNISRVLPIVDIDSGLFFDRNTQFMGHDYLQTLEPRLFYLYVPYVNQDDIPLFDTTVSPFSFAQLFETNRFTGIDRIGDTDQASLAVTSRFINQDTGDEKARASIGQIYYFEQRRVAINTDTLDLSTLANEVPNNTTVSPIAAEVNYFINKNWNITSDIAWDPNYAQTNNANLLFQYKTDNQHIFNASYIFLRGGDAFVPPDGTVIPSNSSKNNLNQTDFSIVWPLARNWTLLARWNYNISHNYPQTYFGGVQYDACCWSFRAIAGREFNYLDNENQPQFDNQIYFQVALKTLGSVGSSSASLLDTIPGYLDTFGHL